MLSWLLRAKITVPEHAFESISIILVWPWDFSLLDIGRHLTTTRTHSSLLVIFSRFRLFLEKKTFCRFFFQMSTAWAVTSLEFVRRENNGTFSGTGFGVIPVYNPHAIKPDFFRPNSQNSIRVFQTSRPLRDSPNWSPNPALNYW